MKVTTVLDSFVLTIETGGCIPARDLVSRAAEAIRKRDEEPDAKLAELTQIGLLPPIY